MPNRSYLNGNFMFSDSLRVLSIPQDSQTLKQISSEVKYFRQKAD
jgi:hypothetical protein